MASSKSSRQNKDFISNVPDIVTDKIFDLLSIREAARTSLLSKQWRRNWLSLKRLIFYDEFCEEYNEDGNYNWQKCNNIINTILLYHNGPIHDFELYIPADVEETGLYLGQWLSFLSKNEVRSIDIWNWSECRHISSYIFLCSELVKLRLFGFTLNPPPIGFNSFPKLRDLVLHSIEFSNPEAFCSLMANCRMLASLRLEYCSGMNHIIIDVPSLESLTVQGRFESLAFRDVRNLKNISVYLREIQGKPMAVETVDAINLLACSCQLKFINFGGDFCKFVAAGGIMRSLPFAFSHHLYHLCLSDLDLDDSVVLSCIFRVLESCPYITLLRISVEQSKNTNQPTLDCNNNLKMDHLLEVRIEGITGSSAELKLIEYLLVISCVLEKLFYRCGQLDTESELKLLRALTGFPRASPKARLVSWR